MTNYDRAEALCNEGLELMMQQEWDLAGEKFQEALEEDPKSPELWFNLGKCWFHLDKFELAINALASATGLNSKYAEAWALMGSCYYAVAKLDRARDCFNIADSCASDDFSRECFTAYAHCTLALGEYDRGFAEYQSRLQTPDTWDGTQSLRGKTLLVKAEGGLGDQIFFSRYSEFLRTLGAGYVLWEVDAPLKSYFEEYLDLDVAVRGEEVERDYMVHAGSLPCIFGTKQGTIPVFDIGRPYTFKEIRSIGLAWSGNPLQPNDHHRTIPLSLFAPLYALEHLDLYQLQKDVRYTDKDAWGYASIHGREFENVCDIANVARDMDLVITVDTMTAHLAGTQGIPTWLLLPYAPDWRWGFEGERTPWYPSVKIFRQGEDRKWEPVIERVVAELAGVKEPHD